MKSSRFVIGLFLALMCWHPAIAQQDKPSAKTKATVQKPAIDRAKHAADMRRIQKRTEQRKRETIQQLRGKNAAKSAKR